MLTTNVCCLRTSPYITTHHHTSPHITIHHHTSPHITIHHHTSPHVHHHTSPHVHHYTSPNITTHHHTSLNITTHHHTSPHITTHHHTSPHITTHHHTSPHITTHYHTSPQVPLGIASKLRMCIQRKNCNLPTGSFLYTFHKQTSVNMTVLVCQYIALLTILFQSQFVNTHTVHISCQNTVT